jgi:hypothetical protein
MTYTPEPAEASTELGADDHTDDTLPEGFAISLIVVTCLLIVAAIGWHMLAIYVSN